MITNTVGNPPTMLTARDQLAMAACQSWLVMPSAGDVQTPSGPDSWSIAYSHSVLLVRRHKLHPPCVHRNRVPCFRSIHKPLVLGPTRPQPTRGAPLHPPPPLPGPPPPPPLLAFPWPPAPVAFAFSTAISCTNCMFRPLRFFAGLFGAVLACGVCKHRCARFTGSFGEDPHRSPQMLSGALGEGVYCSGLLEYRRQIMERDRLST
jgi:hypothetical protein